MARRKVIVKHFILNILVLIASMVAYAHEAPSFESWWPAQRAPKKLVTCIPADANDLREMNLAQSMAGLAALGINEKTTDEAVWIQIANPNYKIYYQSLVKRLEVKENGSFKTWALLKRLVSRKTVRGYILYDCSRNDNSVNLATIHASLQHAVLIDLQQEQQAIAMGLAKLADMSHANFDGLAFTSVRDQLNPNLLVLSNPAISNNRDYAIAQRAVVYYGVDSLLEKILAWTRPLSPVIGWNKGDEFKHIEPCTRWGLINTVSDFCFNLPVLSVPDNKQPSRVRSVDPAKIDWKNTGSFHSFVMSDGDNMQWTTNQFISSKEYWANSANSNLHMSFTSCLLNLSMASRDVYEQLIKAQPADVSFVEYGGGYYYPDLFAKSRPDRWNLVTAYAVRVNKAMKATGVKVFGMICKNLAGEDAQKVYSIFAKELEDITGMIAVQYAPYNGGDGKIYWLKNNKGIDIPVVTARYQLWANAKRKNSGNPSELAKWINADTTTAQLDWTIVHAWSKFERSGTDEITDVKKGEKEGERGVGPVKWTAELIGPNRNMVSIEELLWRIRMKHDGAATMALIKKQGDK